MKEYYIDLGSSTIKTSLYEDRVLSLIEEHSIYFKNGLSKENGISQDNINLLYDYIESLKTKYQLNFDNTEIFATGVFRSIPISQCNEIAKYFRENFQLTFNIISHGIENYYLAKALESDYNGKKVLVVNMGGKTTELVTFDNGKITDTQNLNVGVADMLNNFPESNQPHSKEKLEDMVAFIKNKVGTISQNNDYDCAIFTGGELRFEKLTKYALEENDLFDDGIHDKKISFENFVKGNKKVFYEYTLQQLYDLMPHNPKWMDGARGGIALAQALFELANIKTIVPSDLNLIHGVIKDKF